MSWTVAYLTLHCRHQNDFCIQMGIDESHFNVSFIVRAESPDSVLVDDRFYIAPFSALEQAHCTRTCFYMSE